MDLDKIKDYLVNNKEHIEMIIDPFKKQKEELLAKHDPIMKPLIEDEFSFICKRLISDDLAKNGNFDPKEALYAASILDLNNYFNLDIITIK